MSSPGAPPPDPSCQPRPPAQAVAPDPPPPGRGLLTILVAPRAGESADIRSAAQMALPSQALTLCADAQQALSRAQAARSFGWTVCAFVFDFRGLPAGDLAEQLRRAQKGEPQAEFLVVVERDADSAMSACLQASPSPQTLSFLLSPIHQPEAVAVIRALVERRLAAAERRSAAGADTRTIQALESQLQELTARLEIAMHAAQHDGLTGILNRVGFVEELADRLSKGRTGQTVLLVDLDRFKSVNDTLGHAAGDDLVRKICAAMSAVIPPGGILGRLGGDEFGIIIEGAGERGVTDFCGRILRVCSQARRVSGHEVQISASIGVARQHEGATEATLMRRADLALYAAKREGRNRYRLYDQVIEKAANHRLSIEGGLERALRSGQFKMAYQPIVKAQCGSILGFEALVRWNSPEYGAVSPTEFVPIAEETGLILELGDWITRQAFKDCRRWEGLPYVSVNLSARQFLRQNVAERILRYAEEADLAPGRIQIELTETAIIDDVERAAENLRILRQAGVRVALDDFGTGYSSLVYLNQFAIDCIKIDKSFVDNVTRERQSAIIVASVTRLASSLGMAVVAEGVETEEQRQVLIAAGCGALQGFHFGKPMSPSSVRDLLKPPAAAAAA